MDRQFLVKAFASFPPQIRLGLPKFNEMVIFFIGGSLIYFLTWWIKGILRKSVEIKCVFDLQNNEKGFMKETMRKLCSPLVGGCLRSWWWANSIQKILSDDYCLYWGVMSWLSHLISLTVTIMTGEFAAFLPIMLFCLLTGLVCEISSRLLGNDRAVAEFGNGSLMIVKAW